MRHYLIKFRSGHRQPPEVVGVLRFDRETTWYEREEARKRWAAQHRPHHPELLEDEAMWLDFVPVFDALSNQEITHE